MKSFLQGLLIFFSMCLCGMIAFQWVRETRLRLDVQDLTNKIQDKTENTMNLEAELKRSHSEIQRLDEVKNTYAASLKTNDQQIAELSRDLTRATNQVEALDHAVKQYEEALKAANENVVAANDQIKKANVDLKVLAEERNGVVAKFNKMATDYNDLATKWNRQQEELLKMASTNTPPPPPKK